MLAGCGASGAPGGGGGGGGGGNVIGGGGGALAMTVDAVTMPAAIGAVQPSSGRHFVEVDAALTNGSGSAESIAFALFAVQTASGLRVQASPATSQLAHACAADQSLAPGGTTMCSLAFEVPAMETATTLVWLDPRSMATSTATLPQPSTPTLEAACDQANAQKNPSSSACQSCVNQHCVVGTNACTPSDYNCLAACASPDMGNNGMRCQCVAQCALSDSCKQQLISYMQCETTTCAVACN